MTPGQHRGRKHEYEPPATVTPGKVGGRHGLICARRDEGVKPRTNRGEVGGWMERDCPGAGRLAISASTPAIPDAGES